MLGTGLALVLLVAACKQDVYSGLDEHQVNEMVAVLASHGIEARRDRDKDGTFVLQVSDAEVAPAITLLREAGLPRVTFETLGEVFSAGGVFGTPFEQHARYVHAMNQELSATITAIDGIRFAKVLVTAPQKGRFDQEAPPATASVAIHYERGRDVRSQLSSIKMLVAHALPNLDYDDVAVAIFEAGGPVVAERLEQPLAKPGSPLPARAGILVPSGPETRAWLQANRIELIVGFFALSIVLAFLWIVRKVSP
ncbi:MAG: type III secretion inner membrane ring lipoprotein SctJ [Pseudomonadota bacterium]